ncbi:TRAP transporter large permease [Chelatococcus reniformis]|uniref:TRAP transporter large permease protein n=1 Tax=Chelatococcus reniformis TaxID=1494448 RepID=A0A916XBA8_9HYPH|nr:TRAP transporter large permease [Chelatococcus reniformis]GGC60806.1 C4-dicarboxylate ABC transporter permease [Chelatococcus reniformis]
MNTSAVFLILGVLCLLLLLRIPVAFSILAAASLGLRLVAGSDVLMGILETTPVSAAASYEFVTVPMFLLMAEFVVISGVADGIFRAAAAWVGRFPGGLAVATALAGAGFGAISGSSTAAAATLSATSVPAMLREGYEPKLAYGVVAISGTLAMLIPPSVAMVLYGLIADVSIAALFVGGVIPGIVVAVTIILTVQAIVWLDPSKAPRITHYSRKDRSQALRVAMPMMLLFAGVTGVIYSGVATPTEASAIGALGAFVIAMAARRLDRRNVLAAASAAARTTCMVLMVIVAAHVLAYFLVLTSVTENLISWVNGLGLPRWGVLMVIYAIFLILGCFLDLAAILVLTIPVVLPLVVSLGYDPIWFGIMVIVLGEVGLVTPPVGLNVFVVARVTKQPVIEVFRGVTPHVFAHLIAIAVLTIFPELVLWLPSTMK